MCEAMVWCSNRLPHITYVLQEVVNMLHVENFISGGLEFASNYVNIF